MLRPAARWLPLAVFLLAVGATAAVAQVPKGAVADEVVCPKCQAAIPIKAGETITKCPKCGAAITHIVNLDGTKTSTGATDSERNPLKLVAFGVGGGVLVLAVILAVVKMATGGKPAKNGKKNAKKGKPRDEDDE